MIGSPRAHLRLADSTNERASVFAAAGAPHLGLRDRRRAIGGPRAPRTRLERTTGVGGADVAGGARPGAGAPLAAAVAVCEAAPARCEIKRPNDVWLERRKLAGILVEAALRRVGRCSGSASTS